MKRSLLLICVLFLLGNGSPSGTEIMQRAFNRDDGKDAYFKVKMLLLDTNGNEQRRTLEIYRKHYPDNVLKTFFKFTDPAAIAGTAFLETETSSWNAEQYLYVPAVGRKEEIGSAQKNAGFMNTDFTYGDLQRRRPDQDTHQLLREEVFDNYDCYVVESTPNDELPYPRRVSWIDKKSWVIMKVLFYTREGKHAKTFMVQDLDKRQGIWTPVQIKMEDLINKHKTTMTILETRYNQDLSESLFTIS